MFASQNFNLNGVAFWKRWQEETRDYGARVKVRKDRKESKKKARVERKAKKLERAQVRTESKERDVAHRRDARGLTSFCAKTPFSKSWKSEARVGIV